MTTASLKDAVAPEMQMGEKLNDAEELTAAKQQWLMYTRARDAGHQEWVEDALKFDRYYRGEQWSVEDLAKLEAEGRPALTINMILSTVNVLIGEQSARRVDIQFKPRNESSEELANAVTKQVMAIADKNQLGWKETTVFSDGVIQDRGYFDVRMNFDENVYGDVKIDSLDPTEVIPDPDAKDYDPKKWKEVYTTRWLSLEDIGRVYGKEKANRLSEIGLQGTHFEKDSMKITSPTYGVTNEDETNSLGYVDEDTKKFVRSVRIIDRQYFQNVRIYCLADPSTGKRRELPTEFTKKEAEQFADGLKLPLYAKTGRKVRWRVTADQVVLHDEWSPYKTFTIVPFFPYFRRGKPFGLVRNLISPQEQMNKISSQELHIINSTANGGWLVEKGSLSGMDADELTAQGSKTGLVVEYNTGRNAPEKIKPNTIPTGMDRVGTKAHGFFREISGVNSAMLGLESAEVSGVALESKEARGQVQLQVPLDNLARTRFMLSEKILELVKDFYVEERRIQTTNDLAPGAPNEEYVLNEAQPDGSTKNKVADADFDIAISTMPARDDFNDAQFAEAINLRQAGVAIPDHHVVLYSHLAQKHQIAQEVQQLAGLGEKSEAEQALDAKLQELQIGTLEAELDKLQANAAQLQTQASLNNAKTQDLQSGQMAIEQKRIEGAIAKTERELQLRRELAELNALSSLDTTSMQIAGQKEIAQINAAARPTATADKKTPTKKK